MHFEAVNELYSCTLKSDERVWTANQNIVMYSCTLKKWWIVHCNISGEWWSSNNGSQKLKEFMYEFTSDELCIPENEFMYTCKFNELYIAISGRDYLLFAEASRKSPYPWNPLSCRTHWSNTQCGVSNASLQSLTSSSNVGLLVLLCLRLPTVTILWQLFCILFLHIRDPMLFGPICTKNA